ncbi:MAG TPA: hypothetical protein VKV04_16870, partial [Verrucomicrobiae bacterium]|nr:hypothetical protein [Verrucomicrobiae bacterium]
MTGVYESYDNYDNSTNYSIAGANAGVALVRNCPYLSTLPGRQRRLFFAAAVVAADAVHQCDQGQEHR